MRAVWTHCWKPDLERGDTCLAALLKLQTGRSYRVMIHNAS